MDTINVKKIEGQEHAGNDNPCKMECIANPILENFEPSDSKQNLSQGCTVKTKNSSREEKQNGLCKKEKDQEILSKNEPVILRCDVAKYLKEKGVSPLSKEYKFECTKYLSDKIPAKGDLDLERVVELFIKRVRNAWRKSGGRNDYMIKKPCFNKPVFKCQQDSNMQMIKPKISLKCDECGIQIMKKSRPDPCLPKIPTKAKVDEYMNMAIRYFENQGLLVEASILKEVNDYGNPIDITARIKSLSLMEQNSTEEKDPFEDVSNLGVDYKIKDEALTFEETEACQGQSIDHFVKVEEIESIV